MMRITLMFAMLVVGCSTRTPSGAPADIAPLKNESAENHPEPLAQTPEPSSTGVPSVAEPVSETEPLAIETPITASRGLSAANLATIESGLKNPFVRQNLDTTTLGEGTWQGFTLDGYDYCTLTIKKRESPAESYELAFNQEADYGRFHAVTVGSLKHGILVLAPPVRCFGYSVDPCSILFLVSVDQRQYLIPSMNVDKVIDIDKLTTRFAYKRPGPVE